MTSKQQPTRPTQNMSSSPSKLTPRTLIFSNIYCEGEKYELLNDLRRNYRGIEKAVQIYYEDNNGESIHGVRIDVKSDNFADQFLNKKQIRIYDTEYSIQSLSTKSIIVTKVPASEKSEKILQDLSHNYLNIAKVSRFYDISGAATDNIRIDFKSDASSAKIFKDDYILIDGKRRSIQPYWSLFHIPNQNETEIFQTSEQTENSVPQQSQKSAPRENQKSAPKQPQMYLTERRVKELFREQQMQLEAMINEFENKWNARLSSVTTTSSNPNVEQLVPIMKDLTMVTQQFNQQNAQLQRQLGSVVHQIQDVQFKLNNEQGQSSWPKLPTQNGH